MRLAESLSLVFECARMTGEVLERFGREGMLCFYVQSDAFILRGLKLFYTSPALLQSLPEVGN